MSSKPATSASFLVHSGTDTLCPIQEGIFQPKVAGLKDTNTCVVGFFVMRFEFVYSLQGEKTVRILLKTNQILQRLLKSMPKP